MKLFEDLFLSEEEKLQTETIIDATLNGDVWHILLSERVKDGYRQFYLFDCVKIWQTKIKMHGVS